MELLRQVRRLQEGGCFTPTRGEIEIAIEPIDVGCTATREKIVRYLQVALWLLYCSATGNLLTP